MIYKYMYILVQYIFFDAIKPTMTTLNYYPPTESMLV